MRVIIAGSRTVSDFLLLENAIRASGFKITAVVSGGARGVDKLGERWAERNGIPLERFPAEWEKYGKPAGMIRNKLMADNADALIAIWDGKSAGTKNMIRTAEKAGLKVYVALAVSKEDLEKLRWERERFLKEGEKNHEQKT